MANNRIITVRDIPITISKTDIDDYICITDIASAISHVFKLYLIEEFERLKTAENSREQIEWNAKRFLSKTNYLIQTDAVKNYILPEKRYRDNLEWLAYAEEADILRSIMLQRAMRCMS